MTTEPYEEREIAAALGLSRKRVKEARAEGLRSPADWVLKGARVQYTRRGVRRSLAVIGLRGVVSPAEVIREIVRRRKERAEAPIVMARVTKLYPEEYPAVCAVIGGQRVDVAVRDSRKFVLGMTIPMKRVGGRYILARRCPRWQGRW